MIINKESLATAIRLFISLVLYREKEKDKIYGKQIYIVMDNLKKIWKK